MNAPNSPAPDPDELASALVDGLLSPEEAERARQDPAVGRRVAELLRVRSLVRDTPPPPAGAADRAVAAALDAFEPTRHLQVVERAKAAPPPSPWRRSHSGVPSWLAAAALLVVVVAIGFGLAQLGSGGRDDLDTAGEGSGDDESAEVSDAPSAAEEEADSGAAPQAPSSGEAGTGTLDLGTVDDPDELASRVGSSFDGPARSTTADDAAGTDLNETVGCPDLSAAGDPQRGSSLFTATALYRGSEVVVHVYELDGVRRLVATDTTCADVVDIPYPG